MFSSTDVGRQRELRTYLVEPDRAREVAIPESLADLATRVAALPSFDRLERFARRMGEEVGGLAPELVSVRVELWRTSYDAERLSPRRELLRSVESPRGGDAR